MKKIQVPGLLDGDFVTKDIGWWVEEQLRYDDESIHPKNGIEDRIQRIEEFVGFLTQEAVRMGIVTAEEVVAKLAGWSHNIKIVDEE